MRSRLMLLAVLFVAVAGSAQVVTPPVPVDLGTLGGTFSGASALNVRGQVVGVSATAAGELHAFSWTKRGGMTDLGTLGGADSNAGAVNVRGQVVGISSDRRRRGVTCVLVDEVGRDDRPGHPGRH